jgi:hypothetical protein
LVVFGSAFLRLITLPHMPVVIVRAGGKCGRKPSLGKAFLAANSAFSHKATIGGCFLGARTKLFGCPRGTNSDLDDFRCAPQADVPPNGLPQIGVLHGGLSH